MRRLGSFGDLSVRCCVGSILPSAFGVGHGGDFLVVVNGFEIRRVAGGVGEVVEENGDVFAAGAEGWGEVVANARGAVEGEAEARAAFGVGVEGGIGAFFVGVEVAEEHAGVSAAAGEANLSGEGDWIVEREGAHVVGVIAVE